MARSIPLVPAFRNASRRAAALSAALLPCLPLQGCFNAGEDREYTVKKGEMFSALDMEVAPDGTILLLTQIGMYYSREDAPSDYERSNLHTVLYRRANGAWIATPFKNLQSNEGFFPSFLRDRDGGYRILVLDAGRARSFGPQGDRWLPQADVFRSRNYVGISWDPDKNWKRHPQYGYKDDTTLYLAYWEDNGTAKLREGLGQQKTYALGFGFTPLAFHAGNGYSALFGMERDTGYYSASPRPTLRLWREDPEDMVSFRLDSLISPFQAGIRIEIPETPGNPGKDLSPKDPSPRPDLLARPSEAFFAPYRNGTGLYYCPDVNCRILALDSIGMPASVDSTRVNPHLLDVSYGSKIAPDTGGCLHGAEPFIARDSIGANVVGIAPVAGAMVVWDACRGEKDTVIVWESPTEVPFFFLSWRFRLLPDGSPVIAALVQEADSRPRSRPDAPLARTWLILAERKQGVWSTAVVDSR